MVVSASITGRGNPFSLLFCAVLYLCLLIFACFAPKTAAETDRQGGVTIYRDQTLQLEANERLDTYVRAILENYHPRTTYRKLTIVYPYNESIFPADMAAPTFEWIEKEADTRNWLVMVSSHKGNKPLYILCDKRHWTPVKELWELIKQNSVQGPVQITILGVDKHPLSEIVSKGIINISISRDKVGAPIMFRRVPPSFSYAAQYPESIQWCLADISSYETPPVIMSKQPVCGSCHTFSRDGRFLGMDMDYKKDKGAYFLTDVRESIILTGQDFMSWNDYPRNDGLQSTGLFPRLSPDGKHIASTVNEILFLIMIPDPYFSQLFYPLQGQLAYYSQSSRKIATLPGADLPDVVQTDPSWSPDGRVILFSRATMKRDLFKELGGRTVFSTDETDVHKLNTQYPVQFNVYRIPFNNGQGGRAEPLPGASHNGKSNYYARYSPDGKWIVFTQSATGLAIQPDSKLYIMPAAGGEVKEMRSNLSRVNSWHTWSPNSKWLAFVSKENSPYTELFLTHIDDNGNDSPPVLLARFNKPGYAINVPEFANIPPMGIHQMTLKGN